MAVHLEVRADGGGGYVLLVPPGGQHLVEGEYDLERVLVHGVLGHRTGHVRDDLREEAEGPEVLDDVARLGRDQEEEHVVLKRLVDVSDGVGLDEGVLLGVAHELREGRE